MKPQPRFNVLKSNRTAGKGLLAATAVILTVALLSGCARKGGEAKVKRQVISNCGSDTMVNLAQMWAESYGTVAPGVTVEVAGGGSGVGARDLTAGMTDIANCSRELTASEMEQALKNTGKEPVEWIVGHDAMAIYVHKDNPVESMTIQQLADIFGEGGPTEKWSELNVDVKSKGGKDEIVRISRQNSSGTYFCFREHVLNNKDFKLGSKDMSGSKDVVELVGRTLGAIGYSGMGYADESVKFVNIVSAKDGQAYMPSLENVASGHYPLARPLRMYTLGQPEGAVKAYIDWVLSADGQAIVRNAGYVPVAIGAH